MCRATEEKKAFLNIYVFSLSHSFPTYCRDQILSFLPLFLVCSVQTLFSYSSLFHTYSLEISFNMEILFFY